MNRAYYSASIAEFLTKKPDELLGILTRQHVYPLEERQRNAWLEEVRLLQGILTPHEGMIYFEFSIPRMGKRIDVVLLLDSVIFVLEFKTFEKRYDSAAIDQVVDYALDLKNFHDSSHDHFIAPVIIASEAPTTEIHPQTTVHNDKILSPVTCNNISLAGAIGSILGYCQGPPIDASQWEAGRYRPTPTIIEAAMALYNGHSVSEISRSDAGAINLGATSEAVAKIIQDSKRESTKSLCFVTGVPGAGKTLVGLNIATEHIEKQSELYSVFLSGNGPLVSILREALARDKVRHKLAEGNRMKKSVAMSEVKAFVQNVHNFRDEYLKDPQPPYEHVVLFDEAQRAWTLDKTADFMKRRKGRPGFSQSEPEFLISCLDRYKDWAVVVCLVGGGQEIYSGEAGIGEWIRSLQRSFPHWNVFISPRLVDSEYGAGEVLKELEGRRGVTYIDDLHLAVSMRSFRAENVSLLVKQLLDLEADEARNTLATIRGNYPIVLTRDVSKAKRWLKEMARGSERFGMVASSQAERLKPHAIFVKAPMDPIHWFLDGKEDVRSSYYLEDAATEFSIQGLELDWTCITWDADFRHSENGWVHRSFVGSKWNRISKPERQLYQKNAYRVLLTRARQGMVIVVPEGDSSDTTRKPEFYESTYDYLLGIGFDTI
jgi:hypothetical protein